MNKLASILIGIIAIANVIYSFFENSNLGSFFGFEINIWVYRLFWSFIAVYMFYRFNNKK